MNNITRKKKELDFKQEHILNAAEQVFFSKGVKNATMQEIAKAAEYTKRTLYFYFKTKEEIYYIIIRRAYLLMRDMLLAKMELHKTGNGLEKLEAVGRAIIEFTRKYPDHYKLIAMFQRYKNENESNQDGYLAVGEDIFEYIVFIVREGIQDGSLREELDAITVAYTLYAHVIGMGMLVRKNELNLFKRYPRSSAELIEEAIELFINSVQKHGYSRDKVEGNSEPKQPGAHVSDEMQ